MNTPQPVDPRDLRTCRACGHVFSRVLGTCPNCGALRDHRRKHKKSQRLRDRVDRTWYGLKQATRRYKWYILYIGGGAFIAAIVHPSAMFLAEFSRPPGWRDARWEAGWSLARFFEPFVAAGETLWRWVSGAVVATVAWIGDGIAWLLMSKPSLVFATLVGGGIGAVLAWRRTRRQRRQRTGARHRRGVLVDNLDEPATPPTPPAVAAPDEDWDIYGALASAEHQSGRDTPADAVDAVDWGVEQPDDAVTPTDAPDQADPVRRPPSTDPGT